jgi:hypothetical protein
MEEKLMPKINKTFHGNDNMVTIPTKIKQIQFK